MICFLVKTDRIIAPIKGVSWMVCRYPIRENDKKITKFRKKTCFLHFSAIGFYFRSKKWNTNLPMSITVWFWCFFNTISSKLVFLSFLCNRILFPSKKMDIKFVKDRTKVITKWKAKLSFHEKNWKTCVDLNYGKSSEILEIT